MSTAQLQLLLLFPSKFDEPLYPTEVLIQAPEGGLTINSVALLNHIRSIDTPPTNQTTR